MAGGKQAGASFSHRQFALDRQRGPIILPGYLCPHMHKALVISETATM